MPVDAVTCQPYVDELSAAADAGSALSTETRLHVEACLRCQADLVQYRRLLRSLRALRTEYLEPAPGLVTDILAHLEAAGERHAIRAVLHDRRVAYIGGIAAATAAGAAGALVLASRTRRLKMVG